MGEIAIRTAMKYGMYIFVMCVGFMGHTVCVEDVTGMATFSFDQLYPSSTVSRALNSLRHVWSLAQDLNDNQYDADKVRHLWLELYSACVQLVAQQNAGRVVIDSSVTEYITMVWQLTCKAYDQIDLEDASLGQFLAHMRIACCQVIDRL